VKAYLLLLLKMRVLWLLLCVPLSRLQQQQQYQQQAW
jgi:hypothetical protein